MVAAARESLKRKDSSWEDRHRFTSSDQPRGSRDDAPRGSRDEDGGRRRRDEGRRHRDGEDHGGSKGSGKTSGKGKGKTSSKGKDGKRRRLESEAAGQEEAAGTGRPAVPPGQILMKPATPAGQIQKPNAIIRPGALGTLTPGPIKRPLDPKENSAGAASAPAASAASISKPLLKKALTPTVSGHAASGVSKPAAFVSKPAAFVSKPGFAAAKAAAVVSKPGAAVSKPAATVSKPAAVSKPNAVSKPAVKTPTTVTKPGQPEPLDDEGKAVAQLRGLIVRMNQALPDTLPGVQQDLLFALAECGSKLGSKREEMLAEVNITMQSAQATALENAELAKKKQEQAPKVLAPKIQSTAKTPQEKVDALNKLKEDKKMPQVPQPKAPQAAQSQLTEVQTNLLQQMKDRLAEWSAKIDAVVAKKDVVKALSQELTATEASTEPEIRAKLERIEALKLELSTALSGCSDFARAHGLKEGEDSVRKQLAVELKKVAPRIAATKRLADTAVEEAKRLAESAARRLAAQRRTKAEDDLFAKYDAHGAELWTKDSVERYCKEELHFEVSEAALDRAFSRALNPDDGIQDCIPRREFARLRALLGIERQVLLQPALRAQRLERERKEAETQQAERQRQDARRAELRVQLDAVEPAGGEDAMALAEEHFEKADAMVKQMVNPNSFKEIQDMRKHVLEIESITRPATAALSRTRQRFEAIEASAGAELAKLFPQEHKQLKTKLERCNQHLLRYRNALNVARQNMAVRRGAEAEKHRSGIVACLREHMRKSRQSAADLFSNLCGGGEEDPQLHADVFVSFCKTDAGYKGDEDGLRKFFYYISQEEDGVNLDTFCSCLKAFYKVEDSCLMQTQLALKGAKPVRKLVPGEIIEFITGPEEEPETKLTRIQGRAVKDDAIGWVSLATTKGKAFLTECSSEYKVKVDGPLYEEPGGGASKKAVRPLRKGELVELLQWDFAGPAQPAAAGTSAGAASASSGSAGLDARVRVRARRDGCVGWTQLGKLEQPGQPTVVPAVVPTVVTTVKVVPAAVPAKVVPAALTARVLPAKVQSRPSGVVPPGKLDKK